MDCKWSSCTLWISPGPKLEIGPGWRSCRHLLACWKKLADLRRTWSRIWRALRVDRGKDDCGSQSLQSTWREIGRGKNRRVGRGR